MELKHTKHDSYGYLTEAEFLAMMEAPPSQKEYYRKLAEKREKDAKKRGRG
jgi:hypothetical protein